MGSHLAKMLRDEGNDITIIDDNETRLAKLGASVDVRIVQGNPSSTQILKKAGVDKCNLYIAVYPSSLQETNIVGALLAKHIGAQKAIARVNDEEYLSEENCRMFNELGIELLFYLGGRPHLRADNLQKFPGVFFRDIGLSVIAFTHRLPLRNLYLRILFHHGTNIGKKHGTRPGAYFW